MLDNSILPAALGELIEQRGNSRFETSWRSLSHFCSWDLVSLGWAPLKRSYLASKWRTAEPMKSLASQPMWTSKLGIAYLRNIMKKKESLNKSWCGIKLWIIRILMIPTLKWWRALLSRAKPVKQLSSITLTLRITWVWIYKCVDS